MPWDGAPEATERIRLKDAPDWRIRDGVKRGPSPRTGSSGGEHGDMDWTSGAAEGVRQKVRGCTRCSELELPGTQCARTGTTGDKAAWEWKVWGSKQGEGDGGGATQRGEQEQEQGTEGGGQKGEKTRSGRRKSKRGEEEDGEADGHMEPGPEGPERRGHDGGKGRQEQGEVGREDKEDTGQGKEEKGRPKERTNTDGDSDANARGTKRTRRRRQEKAGGQSRRACTRTCKDEGGG